MSYNIDKWQTKSMVDFAIPLDAVHQLPDISVQLYPDKEVGVYHLSEGFVIEGTLLHGNIIVSEISHWGVGSGNTWDDLIECLKHSKGELIAIQIWERGDEITKLIVKDGVVKEEKIEL